MSSTKGQPSRTTTATPFPALPFIESTTGPRGAHIATNFFAAPKGKYYSEGSQYGHEAAKALLAWANGGCEPHVSLHAILKGVVARSEMGCTDAEHGASMAFLDVVFSAIKFSAKHGVWDGYFDRKAQENARWVEIDRDREAKRIARSIEARRAKQAARKAAKVEGGEHGRA